MKPLYVVGHKNPDCDSVVSAIAYAALKKAKGIDAIACCQGKPNPETNFLLNKFGFDEPERMTSAKCTLAEIDKDEAVLVGQGITMKEALDQILCRKNKGVFVTEDDGKLIGIVSMSDLTRLWTESEDVLRQLMSTATLSNMKRVLDAKAYHEEENFHTNGVIHVMPSMSDRAEAYEHSIVILRNNPDVQRFAIDSKASVLIVSGEDWIDNVTLEKAKENHVSILYAPHTVLECSRLIYQSPSISSVLSKDVVCFHENDKVDEVSNRLAKTRFRTYPVLNDKGQVIAAISRYHLFHYEKKKFVLVDHNEESQSVDDLMFGEVCEIIDHHRMGGIETVNPINITQRTVGSTATIITGLYKQNEVKIDENMAGLLLGGIVTDTLCLRSPTTTQEDIDCATYLSEIAGITAEKLNALLIGASDSILKKSNDALLYDDFKEFHIADARVGIGQAQCKDASEYFQIKDHFHQYISEIAHHQNYDLILFLFTDPSGSGSYFCYTGKKSWVVNTGFGELMNQDGFAKNIISRKKQVLPVVIEVLNQ